MSVETAIKTSIKNYLTSLTLEPREILSYKEELRGGGFCETCYYEYMVVIVKYINSDGDVDEYVWRDSLAGMIETLIYYESQ